MIGNDVWVGYGSTIMCGVTIGDGAVIAAYSLVTRDVLPYQIVGGNPAKYIRTRFGDDIVSTLLQLQWWNLPIKEIEKISQILMREPVLEELKSIVDGRQHYEHWNE